MKKILSILSLSFILSFSAVFAQESNLSKIDELRNRIFNTKATQERKIEQPVFDTSGSLNNVLKWTDVVNSFKLSWTSDNRSNVVKKEEKENNLKPFLIAPKKDKEEDMEGLVEKKEVLTVEKNKDYYNVKKEELPDIVTDEWKIVLKSELKNINKSKKEKIQREFLPTFKTTLGFFIYDFFSFYNLIFLLFLVLSIFLSKKHTTFYGIKMIGIFFIFMLILWTSLVDLTPPLLLLRSVGIVLLLFVLYFWYLLFRKYLMYKNTIPLFYRQGLIKDIFEKLDNSYILYWFAFILSFLLVSGIYLNNMIIGFDNNSVMNISWLDFWYIFLYCSLFFIGHNILLLPLLYIKNKDEELHYSVFVVYSILVILSFLQILKFF